MGGAGPAQPAPRARHVLALPVSRGHPVRRPDDSRGRRTAHLLAGVPGHLAAGKHAHRPAGSNRRRCRRGLARVRRRRRFRTLLHSPANSCRRHCSLVSDRIFRRGEADGVQWDAALPVHPAAARPCLPRWPSTICGAVSMVSAARLFSPRRSPSSVWRASRMAALHPYEYIYFNDLFGGLPAAAVGSSWITGASPSRKRPSHWHRNWRRGGRVRRLARGAWQQMRKKPAPRGSCRRSWRLPTTGTRRILSSTCAPAISRLGLASLPKLGVGTSCFRRFTTFGRPSRRVRR